MGNLVSPPPSSYCLGPGGDLGSRWRSRWMAFLRACFDSKDLGGLGGHGFVLVWFFFAPFSRGLGENHSCPDWMVFSLIYLREFSDNTAPSFYMQRSLGDSPLPLGCAMEVHIQPSMWVMLLQGFLIRGSI
ncbi:hypothetical protein SUGI_0344180 [Cryptomeria japonica]|nr:hypothetical protein SUGI_0344180 [Cryptomeria japonica]